MPKKGTCFLSPHSDDIVMSSHNIILNGFLERPYFLLTIFGISDYVEKTKSNIYINKNITKIRLDEDRIFANQFKMSFSSLNLPDCLKRLKKVIFDPKVMIDNDIAEDIYRKVNHFIEENKIQNIVAHFPNGLIQHLDHRIVWEIACQVINRNNDITLYYVDDIPYSVVDDESELVQKFALNNEGLKKKHESMEIYVSQMCEYFHERVNFLAKKNHGYERIFKKR